MKLVALYLLIGIATVLATRISVSPKYFKHLQGPAEEFGLYQLPKPQANALDSESFTLPALLIQDGEDALWKWEADLPIDSTEQCVFTVISRIKKLQVYIRAEGKEFVELEQFVTTKPTEKIESWYGWSEKDSAPSTSYVITAPTRAVYRFKIVSQEAPVPGAKGNTSNISKTSKPSVFVMLYNKSPLQMHAHLTGNYHQLLVDQEISMQTRVFDKVQFTEQLAQLNRTRSVRHGNDFVTPSALNGFKFISADMEIVMPDGAEKTIIMRDDGEHNDDNANDGVFGGSFQASLEGTYSTQVVMRGLTPEGFLFLRATQHVFTVIENDKLQIEKQAAAIVDPQDEMLKMYLRLQYDKSKQIQGQKFRAYAEVWGTPVQLSTTGSSSSNKEHESTLIPIAFVTSMTVAQMEATTLKGAADSSLLTMELQMSMKWLSKAQATLPLALKNVYVQDASNNIPVAQADHVVIDAHMVTLVTRDDEQRNTDDNEQRNTDDNEQRNTGDNEQRNTADGHSSNADILRTFESKQLLRLLREKPAARTAVITSLTETKFKYTNRITEEMTVGKRPRRYSRLHEARNSSQVSTPSEDGKLILVHGYCAPESPWELSHFTNFKEFKDFSQSRSHDEFALLIREFADQFPAFSTVAHSQGGPATLHLKAFYWSNQDTGSSEAGDDSHRNLQSVGAPYNGNALAGNLAAIGDVLGVGCGVNYDLTRDGSSLWIASIPASARKHVYYYTTQYKDWSWCNMAANLVLSFPNDGVAEYDWSTLEGANNCGHLKGQCHSKGMKYTAQCTDSARNAVLNTRASRGL